MSFSPATYALAKRAVQKRDVIVVVAVNTRGYAGYLYSSVSASRTITLERPFVVEKVETYGRGFGHSSDGKRYSGNASIDYVIDGNTNPSLPVTATESLGLSATYGTAASVEVIGVVAVAVFYGRWL